MTRLTEKDIAGLGQELTDYDLELLKKTGMTLAEIGCFGAGISLSDLSDGAKDYRVSVIPITAGQGIIGGFAYSVESIVKKLGFSVAVTDKADVAGFFEAVSKGNEIIFMADDERFIAFNLRKQKMADNGEATGKGYGAALYGMAKGLTGCRVLVLGYGPVGSYAADFLLSLGAEVAVFDYDLTKMEKIDQSRIKVESNLTEALRGYPYVVDATPEGAFIALSDLHSEAIIAAPGVPLGLTAEAYEKFKKRIIHDPLQIGVATMLALTLSN